MQRWKTLQIAHTPTWHKDLLSLAVEHVFITKETADKIGRYLFFRHFFAHAYGFLLDEAKLEPLINNASDLYSEFKEEIDSSLMRIE